MNTVKGPATALKQEVTKLRRAAFCSYFLYPRIFYLAISLVGVCLAVTQMWEAPSLKVGVVGAVLLAVAVLVLRGYWQCLRALVATRCRIVPYFAERVGAPECWEAWRRGFGIAAELESLDQTAIDRGVRRLSEYGFSRHPRAWWGLDEPKNWWEAEEGLRTIDAIADHTGRTGTAVQDLAVLRSALARAAEKQVRFALLVRWGEDKWISGWEMDQHEGSFW